MKDIFNPRSNTDLVTRPEWNQNGFETAGSANTDSVMTFVDGTRTFSIQPSGAASFDYWIAGVKYTTTGDTVQLSGTATTADEGIWVIHYVGDTLTATQNPNSGQVDSVIRTGAICAILYWNATDEELIYFGEERHGKSMSPSTHSYLHFVNGLEYISGLALTDIIADGSGATDEAQFGVDAGGVSDEDIYDAISAVTSTTGLPIYYMLGATPRWVKYTEAGFSMRTLDGTTADRLAYNQYTGGAWQLTEVGNNDFVLCHVFATTEKDNPMIAIMGQADYATKKLARAGALVEIKSLITNDVLFPEIRPIGTVIFQTNTGYASAINGKIVSTDEGDDYVDWRSETISRVAISTTDHGSLTGLGDDDHTQYALLAGRSGGQTVIGGTDASDDLTLQSTSNATKGKIILGTSAYDEVNNRLGIGTSTPTYPVTVVGSIYASGSHLMANNQSLSWGDSSTKITGNSTTDVMTLTAGANVVTVAEMEAAYDHVAANGSSHSYINQDVTTTASPEFASIVLTPSTDPDVDEAGELSWDSDEEAIRGYSTDNTAQVVMSQVKKTITFSVQLADKIATHSGRSTQSFCVWQNNTGFTFNITRIHANSDILDYVFDLFKSSSETDIGVANDTLLHNVEVSEEGTSCSYISVTSPTVDTIETGKWLIFEHNDETSKALTVNIEGYFDANVD